MVPIFQAGFICSTTKLGASFEFNSFSILTYDGHRWIHFIQALQMICFLT